jgi:hypothetical protein
MACKPNAPTTPSNARLRLIPNGDCNISVSTNKSLRQISRPRYNLRVDNRVLAPSAAPLFLPQGRTFPIEHAPFCALRAAASLLFSVPSRLLKNTSLQLTHSQSLTHSFKNIGGYGVESSINAFPLWECQPVAIRSLIAPLCSRSGQDCARRTRNHPRVANNLVRRLERRADRFSLAIKKQFIPNLPSNRRKRMESERRLQGISPNRTDLQETDR